MFRFDAMYNNDKPLISPEEIAAMLMRARLQLLNSSATAIVGVFGASAAMYMAAMPKVVPASGE